MLTFKLCPHPAKRRTIVFVGGDNLGCCSACARIYGAGPAERCWGCNADRAELKRRGGGDRLREREGRAFCKRCRTRLDSGVSRFNL